MAPKVSVIIPTYNRSHYIREAIDSVLNQDVTDCPLEIIVVDDGSTDDTAAIVKGNYPAVKYIYQPNKGVGAARNRGIEHATGEWVSFLDSDDRWLPNKLSLQFQVLSRYPHCRAVHSNFYTFDDSGIIIEKGLEYWVSVFTGEDPVDWRPVYDEARPSSDFGLTAAGAPFTIYRGNLFTPQLRGLYVSCWTLLIKRECLGKDIRFSEHLKIYEEYWLISRFSENNDILFMDVATAENRGHRGPRVTQLALDEKLKCQIAICDEIYFPSKSIHRPPDGVIEQQYKKLHIALFKEYLKRGRRKDAGRVYAVLKKLKAPVRDFTYPLFRLAYFLPVNIISGLVALKHAAAGGNESGA